MKKTKATIILLAALAGALAAYGVVTTLNFNRANEVSAELLERVSALEELVEAQQEELVKTAAELEEAKSYVAPEISLSGTEAFQGDILSVRVDMNSEAGKTTPSISTPLGDPIFLPDGDGSYVAFVPVWYAQDPGSYEISVTAGPIEKTKLIAVKKFNFSEQHMTMSSATASATVGADNANEDYAEKIRSTFDMYDTQKYWTEPFIQPVDARVSTEFGLYRYTTYTEGGSKSSRHTGIDLAAPEGTPVPASNNGRVIFAGPVIITGNTVVIEHGGGLKTYYFHMSEINCREGDMVKQGDIIGKVGTTGYSTGAHLHFEVKIGSYSLSPWPLFDGTSGIYK